MRKAYHQKTILLAFYFILLFSKMGFTPRKSEQPLRGMELQEKQGSTITIKSSKFWHT